MASNSKPAANLQFRHARVEDAAEVAEIEHMSFADSAPDDIYHEPELALLFSRFPDGCFVALDESTIVAMGIGLFTDFDLANPVHRVSDIGGDTGAEHDPDGDWYYGTSIAVRPEYRGMGIGRRLYELRKGCVQKYNRRGIIAGGVLPDYVHHKDEMDAGTYIEKVRNGELFDSTLTFQLANGFEAPCALPGYMDNDSGSAALIVWHNPDYISSNASTGDPT